MAGARVEAEPRTAGIGSKTSCARGCCPFPVRYGPWGIGCSSTPQPSSSPPDSRGSWFRRSPSPLQSAILYSALSLRAMKKNDILQGTLDLLVLRTLATRGPLHGYAITQLIQQS